MVIGGFAGNLRGSADVTQDLDICYARDDDNLERLAQALRTLNARLRVAIEQDMDLPFQLDAATLRLGDSFTFITDLGDFDILGDAFRHERLRRSRARRDDHRAG